MGVKMAKFKPQFQRLVFIDQEIGKGAYPNCSTLARTWETSTKTIQRDIDYLKWQMNAPIAYDAIRRGYHYTEKNYRLPAIDIKESDLFAIYIAEKALKQYENTPIYGKLVSIFEKIENLLPEKITVRPSWISSRFSFFGEHTTKIDPAIWDSVFTALQKQRSLNIQHQVPGYEEPVPRQIDPYHVVSYRGEWYVIGFCHYKKEIRTFGISRIKKAEIMDKHFKIPQDFDFDKLIGSHFGILWSGREYRVRIRFADCQAPYIKERDWHPTQTIKENKDGSVVLSFKTNHLYEVKRWVLSWGTGAKVLAPRELVEAIKRETKGMVGYYK